MTQEELKKVGSFTLNSKEMKYFIYTTSKNGDSCFLQGSIDKISPSGKYVMIDNSWRDIDSINLKEIL